VCRVLILLRDSRYQICIRLSFVSIWQHFHRESVLLICLRVGGETFTYRLLIVFDTVIGYVFELKLRHMNPRENDLPLYRAFHNVFRDYKHL